MKKTKDPILHLPVKTEYFLAIKSGEKEFEFRLYNEYWKKRLEGKKYSKIKVTKGYPKNTDHDRIVERPYQAPHLNAESGQYPPLVPPVLTAATYAAKRHTLGNLLLS
ncbi:ASCH domain-containing protein [Vibrio cholerae]|uniref:ASCH domain-containing protein n=1 Tax=Vibrio cholerae TaxID=666 RepID=UPI00358E7929